ncbi:MAG: DUF5118 domain-containing protein [Acidobacteriota bacterium]|nr:DUF5118 domain-containing protein [Acidobacteriota bacterium]
MKSSRWLVILLALQIAAYAPVSKAAGSRATTERPDASKPATIAEKTAATQKLPGYFNLYWDVRQGKLWLEIDKWNSEFLYQSGLSAGVGANDIGLDRGQLGATRVVRFERSGPKVLLCPGESRLSRRHRR